MLRSLRLLLIPLGVALLALLIAWDSHPHQAHALLSDSDGDGVMDVSEIVTGSDPHNAHSTPEDTAAALVSGLPLCSDGIDNDGDGLTDSADPGCVDSDSDIFSNAMETFLGSDPNNSSSTPEDSRFDTAAASAGFPLNTCGDGRDNDGDGHTDAADPGCTGPDTDGDHFNDITEKQYGSDPTNAGSVPEHEMANPGSCSDGIDNDLDGMTDAADPACHPLANDDYANASAISSLPFSDAQKVTSATAERGEPHPSCSYGYAPATVWYKYTPAQDGVLVADTAGSDFAATLAVWSSEGGSLTEVICATSSQGRGQQSRAAFHVTGGQTYAFQVIGYISADMPANLGFHLRAGTAPANDDFINAATVSALPYHASGDTTDATTEFGEPGCYGTPQSTLWYRFVPTQTQLLTATATGGSPSSSASVVVFTQTPFGLTVAGCGASGVTSARLAFQVTAGRTYYVQVGSTSLVPPGTVSLDLSAAVGPANDSFASAAAISALPFNGTVDVLAATGEPFEPQPSCNFGSAGRQTVWYRYAATSNGYLAASAAAGDYSTVTVGVYTGSTLADLTEIACGNSYGEQGLIGFAVTAGTTYYIQLSKGSYGPPPVPGPVPEPMQAGSGPLGPTEISFHLETLAVPPCPPAQTTITDPTGDPTTFGSPGPVPVSGSPVDITSVAGGSDSQNVCVGVTYADPLPTPDPRTGPPYVNVGFDIDSNSGTGYGAGPCPAAQGIDLTVSFSLPTSILVPIYPFIGVEPGLAGGIAPPSEQYAFVVLNDRSFTLIVPRTALGGHSLTRFYVSINSGGVMDCAPDTAPPPPPPTPGPGTRGDSNCDGTVNAIDATLILQYSSGMLAGFPSGG